MKYSFLVSKLEDALSLQLPDISECEFFVAPSENFPLPTEGNAPSGSDAPGSKIHFLDVNSRRSLFNTALQQSSGEYFLDLTSSLPSKNFIEDLLLPFSSSIGEKLLGVSTSGGFFNNANCISTSSLKKGKVYITESIFRGVSIFSTQKLKELKGLDTKHAFLFEKTTPVTIFGDSPDEDYVDLCARAYHQFGYIVGVVPGIEYVNIPHLSGKEKTIHPGRPFITYYRSINLKQQRGVVSIPLQ